MKRSMLPVIVSWQTLARIPEFSPQIRLYCYKMQTLRFRNKAEHILKDRKRYKKRKKGDYIPMGKLLFSYMFFFPLKLCFLLCTQLWASTIWTPNCKFTKSGKQCNLLWSVQFRQYFIHPDYKRWQGNCHFDCGDLSSPPGGVWFAFGLEPGHLCQAC
jgi:hypothetical protein